MKMARLNPTIHPTMATSHELAGNRVALHMAIADANKAKAELAPTAQVRSAGGNFRRQPKDNRNKGNKGER